MFQILLKGCIETVNPTDLINKIQDVVRDSCSEIIGSFKIYQLNPYVDYQDLNEGDSSSSV